MCFLVPIEFLYRAPGKLCQIGIGGHGEEAAARSFGKVLQGFGIQFADDMFPVGILPEPVFALCIRNGSAGFCADTDRDNKQSALLCFLGNIKGGINRVLAIAEDDQRIGSLRCTALEILHGFAKHEPEIGAACAGPTAVHLFQRIAKCGVVVGERYHQIRFAGKDDEPDFIRRQGVDELVGGSPRFLQSRGFHVLGFHGAGNIQRDEQIAPGICGACLAIAVDGTGKCQDDAAHGQKRQHGGEYPIPERSAYHQDIQMRGRYQLAPGLTTITAQHQRRHTQQSRQQKKPQYIRIQKTHGRKRDGLGGRFGKNAVNQNPQSQEQQGDAQRPGE